MTLRLSGMAMYGHGALQHRRSRAYMLVECLVYIVVAFILSGVAYAAFYYAMDSSLALRQSADDISNALRVGERWRADVRAARGQIRLKDVGAERILVLPSARGEVTYQFTTNAVLRRVGSGPSICLLEKVKSSTLVLDARPAVAAWRWELELRPRYKKQGRLRPLFTFIAVPERSSAK